MHFVIPRIKLLRYFCRKSISSKDILGRDPVDLCYPDVTPYSRWTFARWVINLRKIQFSKISNSTRAVLVWLSKKKPQMYTADTSRKYRKVANVWLILVANFTRSSSRPWIILIPLGRVVFCNVLSRWFSSTLKSWKSNAVGIL